MKKFKTIKEQREHLVKSKNIVDDELIEKILNERTYVSIINTYKEFFYTSIDDNRNHTYDNRVDFEDYIKLASFDDYIANILHNKIGILERKLKQTIAYEYSLFLVGENNDPYCTSYSNLLKIFLNIVDSDTQINDYTIYDNSLAALGFVPLNKYYYRDGILADLHPKYIDSTIKYRIQLLKSLYDNSSVSSKTKNVPILNHYLENQNSVPFWLIVHQLSLGELISLCNIFNSTLRQNIYASFNDLDKNEVFRNKSVNKFFLQLDSVKNIRNTVNHYEPLILLFKKSHKQKWVSAFELLQKTFEQSEFKKHNDTTLNSIKITKYNKDMLDLIINLFDIIK